MSRKPLKDLLVGALVGVFSMLPGASGAIIAVVFGIYERLIADIANIRQKLLKDLRFIIPVGLGILIGLFVCAVGLDALMDRWEVPMMFFFAALIVTQIPDIIDLGGSDRAMTPWSWVAVVAGFAVMLFFLYIGMGSEGQSSADGWVVWLVAGVIIVASKIAPGVSGASILLALGLYTPLMHAITEFDMSVIVPAGIGMVIGALALAKLINYCIENHRRTTYMAILGLTVGSVVTVSIDAAMDLDGWVMIAESVVGIVVGLVIGVAMSRIASRYSEETLGAEPQ